MKSTEDELPLRRERLISGLAVRPDVLTTYFAARVNEVDPDRAVLVLKATAEILLRRMREVHASATVRMGALDVGRESSKSRDDLSTRIDAAIDINLAPEADWWARAQLAATVCVLSRTLSMEARKQKPLIDVVFQSPMALVRDPERYRVEVLRRWVARARELATVAEREGAPLSIVACDPPGEVVQRTVSVEEVRLSIELKGRLDVVRAG
jgi:hypothetical protein